MTTLIVDTDIVSFLLKGDTRAQMYRPHLEGNTLALSFMSGRIVSVGVCPPLGQPEGCST